MFLLCFWKTFPQLQQMRGVNTHCIINTDLDFSWGAFSYKFNSILLVLAIALKRDPQML